MPEAKGNTAAKEATQIAKMQEMMAKMAEQMTSLQDQVKDANVRAETAAKDAEDRVLQQIAAETDEGRIARQDAHEKLAQVLAEKSREKFMQGPLVPLWLKVNVNIGEGRRNKVMKHKRVIDAEGRPTTDWVGDPVMVPIDVARTLIKENKAERADPLPGDE